MSTPIFEPSEQGDTIIPEMGYLERHVYVGKQTLDIEEKTVRKSFNVAYDRTVQVQQVGPPQKK